MATVVPPQDRIMIDPKTGRLTVAWFRFLQSLSVNVNESVLLALAAYDTNGIVTQTATATFAGRTITGTANEITVGNGSGVSGNPTLSLHAGVYRASGTDVAIADGGTGASTAAGARTNLGLGSLMRDLKRDYGAVGDGTTDDTVALNLAIADFNIGYSIFIPKGRYKYTSNLTTLVTDPAIGRGQKICGEGHTTSTLVPTGAGVDGLTLGGTFFQGQFEDFGIQGGSTTGIGINSPAATSVFFSLWRNLYISMGSHGIKVLSHFSHTLENVFCSSSTGHGFFLNGGICVLLLNTYAGTISTAYKAGYRIGSVCNMISCNGVDAGDYWLIIGSKANVNGTAQAGGASTITLAAGDTHVTDEIIGLDIVITAGTGSGQTRTCSAYNSTTKVATVSSAWGTQPNGTSVYSIRDPDFPNENNNPQYTLSRCNIEAFDKIGILERLQHINCHIDNISFVKGSGNYVSCLRMYKGTAPVNHITLHALNFFVSGGTRTGSADVMSNYDPVAVGINMESNSYYNVDSAATAYFNNLRSDGLDLANIPTADPADGRRSVWANAAVLTRGT